MSILHPLFSILASSPSCLGASVPSCLPLSYVPFIYPLPIWDYWPWLIIPLCAGVAIVYKSVKCHSMRSVPREALVIFVWILVGMAAAAGALAGVVRMVIEK